MIVDCCSSSTVVVRC